MSSLKQEIENRFALQSAFAAYRLVNLDHAYPGWVIRPTNSDYGVAIEFDGDDISECFSGAVLETRELTIDSKKTRRYLTLTCHNAMLRKPFAVLCEEFLEPGNNGEKRETVANNPLKWWKDWKELLGNRQSEDLIYDIAGELMALLKLCVSGRTDAYWTASRMNTHDIEMEDLSYEIKSSTRKESSTIHVSSQFQLKSEKPLFLVFTRLEESETGVSIDDLLVELSKYQYHNIEEYNEYLESRGLKTGNHGRKRKFTVLERRKYLVDEGFPVIKDDLFIEKKIPEGITHIEYDVNLDGIHYETWK